jgi:hypothetical protein
MKLRPIESRDVPELQKLFERQGLKYDFPDLRMLVGALAIEDQGRIVQAVLARPTIELYFLGDDKWRNPQWRMEALTHLHEAMRRELQAKGFEDAHVWIPPQKKSFVSRLMRSFGWTRPQWTNLTRSTSPRIAG